MESLVNDLIFEEEEDQLRVNRAEAAKGAAGRPRQGQVCEFRVEKLAAPQPGNLDPAASGQSPSQGQSPNQPQFNPRDYGAFANEYPESQSVHVNEILGALNPLEGKKATEFIA